MIPGHPLNNLDWYWNNIKDADIATLKLEALFLMRVAAFRYIADTDEVKKNRARKFLLATMTQSEEEYNFQNKENFVIHVDSWEYPKIIAQRSKDIHAVLYTINYHQKGAQQTLHELSFFEKNKNNQYKFTHKYDLIALSKKYFIISQEANIRLIGDPVLHREALQVTDFSETNQSQLSAQIEILSNVLVTTGGVGIAANQCSQIENPWKITLTGVDYKNPEHVAKAIARYPTTLFPQMKIQINPIILSTSKEKEAFPEGCLSVRGLLRASVLRPVSLTIAYQDIFGDKHVEVLHGSDARVMLHEVDHILNGKVYIQYIIEELSTQQLNDFLKVLDSILLHTEDNKVPDSFSSPLLVFRRKEDNKLIFDDNELQEALIKVHSSVLKGIQQYVQSTLGKRVGVKSMSKRDI